jgi:hypothetical protein
MEKSIKDMTELEMAQTAVPWPRTIDELNSYINELVTKQHDYGTCVYAMSMAAVATFYYMSHELGVTGFQASCADLDFLKRTRSMKSGFKIMDYGNFLYPQYADKFEKTITPDTWKGIQKSAKEAIKKANADHAKYLTDLEKYDTDLAAFVAKHPDYYERPEYYEHIGMGTSAQWDEEHKKEEGGFEFAPSKPYDTFPHIDVYSHWQSIVNGTIPFGYMVKEDR